MTENKEQKILTCALEREPILFTIFCCTTNQESCIALLSYITDLYNFKTRIDWCLNSLLFGMFSAEDVGHISVQRMKEGAEFTCPF